MRDVGPIRNKTDVNKFRKSMKEKGDKYEVMFCIGAYTGMRISDILRLKVKDVYKKDIISIKEKKTGKKNDFIINKSLEEVFNNYCKDKDPEEVLIVSREGSNKAIGRNMAYKVMKEVERKLGLSKIGTHSLRKTFGYHYYKKYKDVATLQKLFNHSDPSTTLMYIGITEEEIRNRLNDFSY